MKLDVKLFRSLLKVCRRLYISAIETPVEFQNDYDNLNMDRDFRRPYTDTSHVVSEFPPLTNIFWCFTWRTGGIHSKKNHSIFYPWVLTLLTPSGHQQLWHELPELCILLPWLNPAYAVIVMRLENNQYVTLRFYTVIKEVGVFHSSHCYLFNRFFKPISEQHQSSMLMALCNRIHRRPVVSSLKGHWCGKCLCVMTSWWNTFFFI